MRDASSDDREGVAAPPDDGHQGSFSLPADTLEPTRNAAAHGPPLHRDAVPRPTLPGSLVLAVFLIVMILGVMALALYWH